MQQAKPGPMEVVRETDRVTLVWSDGAAASARVVNRHGNHLGMLTHWQPQLDQERPVRVQIGAKGHTAKVLQVRPWGDACRVELRLTH